MDPKNKVFFVLVLPFVLSLYLLSDFPEPSAHNNASTNSGKIINNGILIKNEIIAFVIELLNLKEKKNDTPHKTKNM